MVRICVGIRCYWNGRLLRFLSLFLGRSCLCPARDRREDRFPRVQGQVDAARLQGMFNTLSILRLVCNPGSCFFFFVQERFGDLSAV